MVDKGARLAEEEFDTNLPLVPLKGDFVFGYLLLYIFAILRYRKASRLEQETGSAAKLMNSNIPIPFSD
jgi:hypothetical protein